MRLTTTQNVLRMPAGERSPVIDLLRYHAFVRVFDGDPDRWIAALKKLRDSQSESDIRFARWVRERIRRDPRLLERIRIAVERTPIWGEGGEED
jgi:hypothetical protein